MLRRAFFFPTIAAFLAVSAPAADDARIVTWEEAVRIAAAANPDLLAALRSAESRKADYKESFNNVLPSVSLSNSYTQTDGDTSQSNRWRASGGASIDVFNTAAFAGISVSRSSYDQSLANLRSVSSSLLFNLRSAFAELLYQQRLIDVSDAILAIRRKNTNLVSLRYDSGRESKGNRLRARAELLEAESNLNQAHRDVLASQQEFKRRLGDESFSTLVATGSLAIAYRVEEQPRLEGLVDINPDVEFSAAQLRSADAGVRIARSALWPNLSASYTRSFQGRDYFPDEPSWSASGVVSLPIFSGGISSAYYSISAAKRSREQAEENLRSTRYRVRTELESAWSNLNAALEQVEVQQAFLEAARQRNSEADVRYSNGLMSYEDWERVVTDRVNFERSVIRAQRDAIVAEAQWSNSRGIQLGDMK